VNWEGIMAKETKTTSRFNRRVRESPQGTAKKLIVEVTTNGVAL